jgi:hypothetical protein
VFRVKKIRGSDSGGADEEVEKDVSIELILAAGIDRGLRKQDADTMTIGMWIDYIIEWNNIHNRNEEKDKNGKSIKKRKATQTDFNNF